ncbi:hypothetical protein AB1Y20_023749 [Prymnesium parvum]|uniref:CMP/dCMP-type deaminase domain-containing protein n=1 Tax=Prymnesium parvum TaxID=97485 RepID=A0AB34JH50_PRYPA
MEKEQPCEAQGERSTSTADQRQGGEAEVMYEGACHADALGAVPPPATGEGVLPAEARLSLEGHAASSPQDIDGLGALGPPAMGEVVLPLEATRPLELIDVCVADASPQEVSGLVRLLSTHAPSAELRHLKRVCRGEGGALAVLLWARAPRPVPPALHAALAPLKLRAAAVPRHAPLTRAQFSAWGAVWPVHFHESAAAAQLAKFLPPPHAAEHAQIARHMRAAVRLAAAAAARGGAPVGALLVRPSACAWEAADARGASQPLRHALMLCVEQVARDERARREQLAGGAEGRKRPECVGVGRADRAEEHLCAGCDAYVTVEPCAMCAMALVHSRVRRVFYAIPAPEQGALGSRFSLHTEHALNHRFQVVRNVLREEALAELAQYLRPGEAG